MINTNKTPIIKIPLYKDIEKETLKLFRSAKKNKKREIPNYETITKEKKENNH